MTGSRTACVMERRGGDLVTSHLNSPLDFRLTDIRQTEVSELAAN